MGTLGNRLYSNVASFTLDTAGGLINKVNVCKTPIAIEDGTISKVSALMQRSRTVGNDCNKIVICDLNGDIIENGISNTFCWTTEAVDIATWVDFTFLVSPAITTGSGYLIYNISSSNAASTYYLISDDDGGRMFNTSGSSGAFDSPDDLNESSIEVIDRMATMYITYTPFVWEDHFVDGSNWGLDFSGGELVQFANSEFQIIAAGNPGWGAIYSDSAAIPWKLVGDFDLQFSLNINAFLNPSYQSFTYCEITESGKGASYIVVNIYPSGDQFFVLLREGAGEYSLPADNQINYKFRFVRIGEAVRVYYWTNNRWEWDGDLNGHLCSEVFDRDIYVWHETWSRSPSDYIFTGLDYVRLVTGTKSNV